MKILKIPPDDLPLMTFQQLVVAHDRGRLKRSRRVHEIARRR